MSLDKIIESWGTIHDNPIAVAAPPSPAPAGVAGLMTDAERLTHALNKVLMEYPAIFERPVGSVNLSAFLFLLDQLAEEVPRIHPMEVAQQLALRLFPTGDRQLIADAFQLGTLIASPLANRTTEHIAKIKDEMQQAAKAVAGWKPIPSVYDPNAPK